MRLLHCTGDDAALWSAFVHNLPIALQDVHFLPEYAAIYHAEESPGAAFGGTGQACALWWEGSEGAALYPFLLRPVRIGGEQPRINGCLSREMVGLYGMGGPLLACAPEQANALYAAFDARFQEWCAAAGLASEFICPHLFTGSLARIQASSVYRTVYTKDIVVIPLVEPSVWALCNKGRKYEINLARRSGVTVTRAEPDAALHAALHDVYCQTMHRKQAADRWYVADTYFQDCLAHLGAQRVSFFVAHAADGTLCAWNMLLHHGHTAYYHFAGVTQEGLRSGAPSLLLHHASLWAQAAGYRRLYLGGGVTSAPDDAVFRFKHSFSRHTLPFFRAWRVLHEGVYADLCQRKFAHERLTGYVPAQEDFFPLYRR